MPAQGVLDVFVKPDVGEAPLLLATAPACAAAHRSTWHTVIHVCVILTRATNATAAFGLRRLLTANAVLNCAQEGTRRHGKQIQGWVQTEALHASTGAGAELRPAA